MDVSVGSFFLCKILCRSVSLYFSYLLREFKLVAKETYEYTLSEEDIGSRIMFSYTPVNSEG